MVRAEIVDDREVIRSRRVLDRLLFDLVAYFGDVLASARRGVASTEQRCGAQEGDQSESQ
jgi:hypothetical protein